MQTTISSNALTTKNTKKFRRFEVAPCCCRVAVSFFVKEKVPAIPLHVTVIWLFMLFGRHSYCTVRNFRQCFFRCLFFRSWLAVCTFHWVAHYLLVRDSISSLLLHTIFMAVCLWLKALLVLVGALTHTHTTAEATSLNFVTEPLIANHIIYFYFFFRKLTMLKSCFLYTFYVNFHWEPNRWVLW